jgi:hypothetical protein
LSPHIVARGLGAFVRGNRQGRSEGASKRQLPGAAIIDRDGQVLHHQIASDAADHLSAAQLIEIAGALGLPR